jgi:hypothetical protein
MPNNTENTLASRINTIKLLTGDFPDKATILDLKLSHLLDIFLYRKKENLVIFPSLTECIKDKAKDNEILLYLFLNTLEKEHAKADSLEILGSESKGEIEQQINGFSSSELPEPSFYKGWGFRFSKTDISEQDGKLHITIDDIFDGSKLTEYDIKKGNTIIIENPEAFKTDGNFDIGKIAQHIRMQESLTAIKSDREEVEIKQGEKKYFYQDEKNSKFMAFSIKEGISIEEAKKQEEAILSAHNRVKQKLQDIKPANTPSEAELAVFSRERTTELTGSSTVISI